MKKDKPTETTEGKEKKDPPMTYIKQAHVHNNDYSEWAKSNKIHHTNMFYNIFYVTMR